MNISLETKIFLGISIGTLLFVGLIAVFLGRGNSGSNIPATVSAQTLIPASPHSIGPVDAKVTIVEFSDFECPACQTAQPVVDQILSDYASKSARLIYREYPLQVHPYAYLAAQAAESAGLQGKFWEMHDELFKAFESSPTYVFDKDKALGIAKNLGLDLTKFGNDFDSDAVKALITKDQDDANAAGLDATPTFFINGTKFTGGLSLSQFEQEINSRLK